MVDPAGPACPSRRRRQLAAARHARHAGEAPNHARHAEAAAFSLFKMFQGVPDPPKAFLPPQPSEAIPELAFPEAPGFPEASEEERALQAFTLERLQKAAAFQDGVVAALEKKYGTSFAEHYADVTYRNEQFQEELFKEDQEALARARKGRELYVSKVGHTPEEESAIIAARGAEAGRIFYDRFLKAVKGEEAANPVVEREVRRQQEVADEIGRRTWGAWKGDAWQATEGGRRLREGTQESVAAQRYAANLAELGMDAGQIYGIAPATARMLEPASGPAGTRSQGLAIASGNLGVATPGLPQGTQPFLNYLAADRANQANFDSGLYRTQYGGALTGALLPYENYYRQILQNQGNRYDAGRTEYTGAVQTYNTFQSSAMGMI